PILVVLIAVAHQSRTDRVGGRLNRGSGQQFSVLSVAVSHDASVPRRAEAPERTVRVSPPVEGTGKPEEPTHDREEHKKERTETLARRGSRAVSGGGLGLGLLRGGYGHPFAPQLGTPTRRRPGASETGRLQREDQQPPVADAGREPLGVPRRGL